jgi:hypothetical protein
MANEMNFKKLKLDKKFQACSIDDGDEIFPNGIFLFNITKMMEYITQNKKLITLENIDVEVCRKSYSSCLNEETVLTAQTSNPIVLAEISPGNFNVIDGNHRLEKAFRDGLKEISAYRLTVNQHVRFLTTAEAYKTYVQYWNSKVAALNDE